MKSNIIHTIVILVAMSLIPARAEIRTLVSSDGKSIRAELVSHSKGKITIRREDGQEFELDPAIFCKQDQEAIQVWMESQPATVTYDFDISVDKKVLSREAHGDGRSQTTWVHEISVRNDSQDVVKNIRVLYRILHESWGQTHMMEGDYTLQQDLDFNRTLVVKSDPLDIWRDRHSRNSIKGCLVRVLDPNGEVIADWVSNEVGMKDVTWESTSPREHHQEPEDRAVIR